MPSAPAAPVAAARAVTYRVIARREDGRWVLRVPDLRGLSAEVQRLDAAEAVATRAIARETGAEVAAVAVSIGVELDREGAGMVERMVATREVAIAAARDASDASRTAIRHLLDRGLSVRDIAAVLGISHQRVSQLSPRRGAGSQCPERESAVP